MSATRYCMTVTGVDGNFLNYGNDKEQVDIRYFGERLNES